MSDARTKLISSLEEVRKHFLENESAWRERLVQTFLQYLKETEVEKELWAAVFAFRNELANERLKQGIKATSFNTSNSMAAAAAGATVLKQQHGYPMDVAVRNAAKASGVDRAKLKNFRNNISSRNLAAETLGNYDCYLAEFKIYSEDELLTALGRLRGFLR